MRASWFVGVAVVALAPLACSEPSSENSGSAAILNATCQELVDAYEVPSTEEARDEGGSSGHPNGPPSNSPNSEVSLTLSLADPDLKVRADAAMKLLRHSERRIPASLEAAIHAAGLHGDFRVLNNLEAIVTERMPDDQGDPGGRRVPYPVRIRTAAAAAIGRILEQDRSAPPGRPSDETGGGISDEMTEDALEALQVGACVSSEVPLRAASIEALGLARNDAVTDFLELVFANPGEQEQASNLFLQVVAGRALTNITENNHLATSNVDERAKAMLEALRAAAGTSEGR